MAACSRVQISHLPSSTSLDAYQSKIRRQICPQRNQILFPPPTGFLQKKKIYVNVTTCEVKLQTELSHSFPHQKLPTLCEIVDGIIAKLSQNYTRNYRTPFRIRNCRLYMKLQTELSQNCRKIIDGIIALLSALETAFGFMFVENL